VFLDSLNRQIILRVHARTSNTIMQLTSLPLLTLVDSYFVTLRTKMSGGINVIKERDTNRTISRLILVETYTKFSENSLRPDFLHMQ